MILTGARSGFFKSQSVVVFTYSKSTPPPSQVQFMPPTHNITAHLASLIEKDRSNQKECEGYMMTAMDMSGKLCISRNLFVASSL